MFGCNFMDTNREGVQHESGSWASPTAPPMLVGRFLKKTFKNSRGEDEEFTGAVMGFDEPYFKVQFTDGDCQDMTKEELMPLLIDLETRKPAFPYSISVASCSKRLAGDVARAGGAPAAPSTPTRTRPSPPSSPSSATTPSSPSRPPRRSSATCGVKFGNYDVSWPSTRRSRRRRCAS